MSSFFLIAPDAKHQTESKTTTKSSIETQKQGIKTKKNKFKKGLKSRGSKKSVKEGFDYKKTEKDPSFVSL